jgi:beta-galactosidase
VSGQSRAQASIQDGALVLSGDADRRLPFVSAALHYHDLARANWGRCLDAVGELGFELVDSCVPWSLYEPARDDLRFDGPDRPALRSFLEACAERELKVLLQLGPLLDLELADLGLPPWIARDPRYLARGAQGNPLLLPAAGSATALPSLHSQHFIERVEHWLAGVAHELGPFCYPNGPLVAVHVGARAGVAGRMGVYDHDYHPDAIAAYRDWLARRYPDGMPSGYRRAVAQTEPPRRFDPACTEELVVQLDWIAFKEAAIGAMLEHLTGCVKRAGLERVALLHGLDSGDLGLSTTPGALEGRGLDAAGLELAAPTVDRMLAQRTAQWLHGNSRLPLVWRMAWGNRPWFWVPQRLEQQFETALTALMHGVRGASFSSVVERNHWYDTAISSTGHVDRQRAEPLQLLIRALRDLRWHDLRRQVKVGWMRARELDTIERCSSIAEPIPPQLLALVGLRGADLVADDPLLSDTLQLPAVTQWAASVEHALQSAHVSHDLVDPGQPIEQLRRYRVLVVALPALVDPALLQRLGEFVARGGKLVLGPAWPRFDLAGHELTAEAQALPEDCLVQDAGALDNILAPYRDASTGPIADPSELDTELHLPADPALQDGVLFLHNRSETAQTALLRPDTRCWDALTGAPVTRGQLELQPQQLKVLRFRPEPSAEHNEEQ